MKKKKKIYEGRAKKLYETDDLEQLIQEFKDDIPTATEEKKGVIRGKGIVNNEISGYLFEYLEGFHVHTHFIKTLGVRDMLIRKLEMIPIEIMIRNIAAGSLSKRYHIAKGKVLDYPIIEYFYRDSDRSHPLINTTHAVSFGYAKIDELRTIDRLTSKINAILKSFFLRRGLTLVDFKLEFGRYKNKILLGDEISLDTCRLWDDKTEQKFDKEHVYTDQTNAESIFEELKKRIFQQN